MYLKNHCFSGGLIDFPSFFYGGLDNQLTLKLKLMKKILFLIIIALTIKAGYGQSRKSLKSASLDSTLINFIKVFESKARTADTGDIMVSTKEALKVYNNNYLFDARHEKRFYIVTIIQYSRSDYYIQTSFVLRKRKLIGACMLLSKKDSCDSVNVFNSYVLSRTKKLLWKQKSISYSATDVREFPVENITLADFEKVALVLLEK